MGKVIAGITTSIDGYITGPDDGPGKGLGEGGERLPFFIVTHRPEDQPEGDVFRFVDGLENAIAAAQEAAGEKHVHVMGGADVIRQALEAQLVDELAIIIAPVVLGGGKRLFEGFDKTIELEHLGVRQSPFATFIEYRVVR